MNKIAETLRCVAKNLYANNGGFICHEIAACTCTDSGAHLNSPSAEEGRKYAAIRFLESLGMPLDGGGFQSWSCHDKGCITAEGEDNVPYATRLELRVTWCEFAAMLAEEWDVK